MSQDLAIDVKEESGLKGPCIGCVTGCAKYWCLCQGPWKLLCAECWNETSEDSGLV
jgi:hypothetical protein